VNEKQYVLVKLIQKIEIFAGFGPMEVQRLLRICRFKNFAKGEKVYSLGGASDEMLIGLRGAMLVVGADGRELARIGPGKPLGEMGLFTGQPRSADIVAAQTSTALILTRSDLTLMLGGNPEMMAKILENVVGVLSARVEDTNAMVASQSRIIHELEKKLAKYEGPKQDDEDDGLEGDDDEDDYGDVDDDLDDDE
jgi:CRP-like cAMP-binding protein